VHPGSGIVKRVGPSPTGSSRAGHPSFSVRLAALPRFSPVLCLNYPRDRGRPWTRSEYLVPLRAARCSANHAKVAPRNRRDNKVKIYQGTCNLRQLAFISLFRGRLLVRAARVPGGRLTTTRLVLNRRRCFRRETRSCPLSSRLPRTCRVIAKGWYCSMAHGLGAPASATHSRGPWRQGTDGAGLALKPRCSVAAAKMSGRCARFWPVASVQVAVGRSARGP